MAAAAGLLPGSSNSADRSMLTPAALGFINHLLDDENWARARLKPFAGQTARLACGQFETTVEITAEGNFRPGAAQAEATVHLTLPPDAPWRALIDRTSLLADVHVSGSAELAECLGFVFRNLNWDVENDLAQLVGDIAARRLIQGGQTLVGLPLRLAGNLAQNFAEYLTEENPLIARKVDVTSFASDITDLAQASDRLEKRLQALSGR